MENAKKIFVDGMVFKNPHEKAPDFIKGNISLNAPALTNFMNLHKNEKGWLTVILKKSKAGKMYFELDTWKPNTEKTETLENSDGRAIDPDLIPF